MDFIGVSERCTLIDFIGVYCRVAPRCVNGSTWTILMRWLYGKVIRPPSHHAGRPATVTNTCGLHQLAHLLKISTSELFVEKSATRITAHRKGVPEWSFVGDAASFAWQREWRGYRFGGFGLESATWSKQRWKITSRSLAWPDRFTLHHGEVGRGGWLFTPAICCPNTADSATPLGKNPEKI